MTEANRDKVRISRVYEIRFSNGTVYVGKTSQQPPTKRFTSHKYNAFKRPDENDLHRALTLEPNPEFVIVAEHLDQRECLADETRRIREKAIDGVCLNHRKSTWGNRAWEDSAETKEKKRQGRLGKKHTDAAKELLRQHNLGKTSPRKGATLDVDVRNRVKDGVHEWIDEQGPDFRVRENNPHWKGDNAKPESIRKRAYNLRNREMLNFKRAVKKRQTTPLYVEAANVISTPFDFL